MEHTKTFVCVCITDALFRLMRSKSLQDISITELTQVAGVGRASFYRNFETKIDVLDRKLDLLLLEWGKDFEARNDPSYFAESIFRHFYKHREIYLLIYRQGLSNHIYSSIRRACKIDSSSNSIERYIKSMVAGTTFGMIDEWMRGGMQESPDDIIRLAESLTPNI